ncbi:MAG TPA: Rne/Rng family ribonuclease [Candidatus Angelobacter sp.]|nr:Rne/Rng family ribonuclease [Candidatus Angelobacter sp.]
MSKELFVSSTPHETKVAVVEEDQLAEIYYERENEYTLAGSIYKGRVTRVLPGMQSAFVNIGLERDAFLYVSDFLLEEDEDADTIGEAVSRSSGSPIIEVRSEQHPVEGDELLPPLSTGAEEESSEEDTQESASAENGGQQEPEREGARKWRGRRRRGGRGRERFSERGDRQSNDRQINDRQANDRQTSDRQSNDRHENDRQENESQAHDHPVEAAEVEGGEQSESREEHHPEPRHESRPEPRYEHHRSAPKHEYPEPILLPGESISKYQPREAAASTAPTQPKAPSAPRPKPSTEYSLDPSQFSAGSMVLPGESLAKYGKHAQQSHAVAETDETHSAKAEPQQHGFLQDAESAGPVPAKFEQHEHESQEQDAGPGHEADAEARVEAPSGVFHRREVAEAPTETETETEELSEEDQHTEQAREEERFGSMNIANAFGNGVAEAEEAKTSDEGNASEQTTVNLQASPTQNESRTQEQKPWYADSARGVMEEEEIEEEESDIPGFQDDVDLTEFDEMEEEVLGQAGDQMLSVGTELMEAVRDAHVNERATGKYEVEGLEPEELEQVEEAFVLAEEDSEGGEEGEEGEEESEELENGNAEQHASAGAGYQHRPERKQHDRRGGRRGSNNRRMRGRPRHQAPRQMPAISDLLKEGQEILVQIAKEPIAKKGARITSHIALPGRYLVYMPTVHHTGVSRKIASEDERHRLKRIALSERGDAPGGFIVRTAAAGAEEQDLRNDIRFLINLWNEIRGRAETSKAPALIYHDLNLVERILRDQVSGSFSAIWADTEQEYERILRFVSRFQPSLVKRVKLYSKDTPLFEQFNITDEINKALKSKVWLRSGGYIVINQTEALVAIDINTGKFVGKTARLEDTIVKTNIDAIKEIVRQIRLRDLGGIIVIDFIDMDERRNRQKVMQALEEALKADRAPSKVLQFNDFGLVAITRKRVKQSLERTLGQPCPTCQATGMIKSVTTVCNEIYVEMRKMMRHFERDVMVRVNPEVAKALKSNNGRWLQDMEELVKKTVLVKSDPLLHPEQFDIQ